MTTAYKRLALVPATNDTSPKPSKPRPNMRPRPGTVSALVVEIPYDVPARLAAQRVATAGRSVTPQLVNQIRTRYVGLRHTSASPPNCNSEAAACELRREVLRVGTDAMEHAIKTLQAAIDAVRAAANEVT